MRVNLKTNADNNFEGMCPSCKEWTTAGDSCCGRGAWVEGGMISDESAQETQNDPTVGITVLADAPQDHASALHQWLFTSDVSSMMWSRGNSGKWNVTIHIPISSLPGCENKFTVQKETSDAGPTAWVVYRVGDDEAPGKPFATEDEANECAAELNKKAREE